MATILDCTLRDGSYVNNFQFTARDTKILCEKLQESGISFIEIGHGLGFGASRKGGKFEAAATDEEYLAAAQEVITEAKYGMFCIPGIATLDDVDLGAKYGMDFIRVGVNVTEVERTQAFVERAKHHGMYVATNYMKSYAVSPETFLEKVRISKSYGVDLVYLVDSAGGMLPEEVENYFKVLRDNIDIDFGYHGHNNLGLAVSNSLLAAKMGATFVDTSLQGLGRSAGNASTEQVALLFERQGLLEGIDLFGLLDIGFDLIKPMISRTGMNPIDMVAGFALFHSSYMPLIRKYSDKYSVDPRELIIELCKKNQVDAPEELVESIASGLDVHEEEAFLSRYQLDRYYVNEQQS